MRREGYQQVAGTLARPGLCCLAETPRLARFIPFLHGQPAGPSHDQPHSRRERVLPAFAGLGSTCITLSQVLSIRMDLLPPEYLRALVKLQDTLWREWVRTTFRTSLAMAAVLGIYLAWTVLRSGREVPRNRTERQCSDGRGVVRGAGDGPGSRRSSPCPPRAPNERFPRRESPTTSPSGR